MWFSVHIKIWLSIILKPIKEFFAYVIKSLIFNGIFYRETINCRNFDHQRAEIGPPFETVVFPEFIVLCPRRKGASSTFSCLTSKIMFTNTIFFITLHYYAAYFRNIPVTDYFSICLAPLYGTEPKWLLLSEFFKHYKIQGVTHFYVYINKIDEYSRILLDDYVRSGEAEVVILRDRFERDGKSWQLPELQVGVIVCLKSSSCSKDEYSLNRFIYCLLYLMAEYIAKYNFQRC
uniref:Glycosyltransferase family 92 protein n=1 Tax=Angiostrongylus cantonensis TaxID=6313 RepID=A0A0K0D8N2_ANGCA